MERMSRNEYMDSYWYKIVYMLSKYRHMANDVGADLSIKLDKILKSSQFADSYTYDECFLLRIETGFIQLTEEAVEEYVAYVASLFRFDFNKFYSKLKYEAMRLSLGRDEVKNNKAVIRAIASIAV